MKAKLDELIKEFGITHIMSYIFDANKKINDQRNIEKQNEFLDKINNCIEIILGEKSFFLDKNFLIDKKKIDFDTDYLIKINFGTKRISINHKPQSFVGIEPFILDYFAKKYTTVSDFEIINIPF